MVLLSSQIQSIKQITGNLTDCCCVAFKQEEKEKIKVLQVGMIKRNAQHNLFLINSKSNLTIPYSHSYRIRIVAASGIDQNNATDIIVKTNVHGVHVGFFVHDSGGDIGGDIGEYFMNDSRTKGERKMDYEKKIYLSIYLF